jgi:anaerobic ribonucleoside-triphosphate reductase activating protein
VHVQGCGRRCAGCFNPETHDPAAGREVTPVALAAEIAAAAAAATAIGFEGVTVSGGEPFDQAAELHSLLAALRDLAPSLSVLVYSGYTRAELEAMPAPGARAALALVDVLIDGPYLAARAVEDGVRGSANQVVHFLTSRYGPADFAARPGAFEVRVGPGGALALTGFPPERVRRALREAAGGGRRNHERGLI